MKKKTLLASAIMMAAGAMLGTTTAPEQVTQEQTRQVAEKSNQNSGQQSQQQPRQRSRQRLAVSDLDFGKAYPTFGNIGGFQHFRKQASWCFTGSKSFNKIRHGRQTRRKHRRAA